MKDRIKNLKSTLNKGRQSWHYVWNLIDKVLSTYDDMPYHTKNYLFQCQVLLDSNEKLLDKYETVINELKEDLLTNDEYENISQVLRSLITDHQAKAISIDNILRKEK